MHYMHLPTFEQQTKGLMEYLYKANAVMVRAIVVCTVSGGMNGVSHHHPPLAATHRHSPIVIAAPFRSSRCTLCRWDIGRTEASRLRITWRR